METATYAIGDSITNLLAGPSKNIDGKSSELREESCHRASRLGTLFVVAYCERDMLVENRALSVPCRCSQLFCGPFTDRGCLGRSVLKSLTRAAVPLGAQSSLLRRARSLGGGIERL